MDRTTYLFKLFFCIFLASSFSISAQPVREKLSLDKGWRFFQGDIPFPKVLGHSMSYHSSKAGAALGPAAINFDDRGWKTVNLPHDWAVENPFDSLENLSQGFRKRGIGWYRRSFRMEESERGKNIELQLDGIATNSTIWVNGHEVGHNWSGYTSIYIDLSSLLLYGDNLNTIAVRVDAEKHEGWWYEGAGIYRHTWLVKRNPLHVITDGIYAHPVKMDNKWVIPAEVTVENRGKNSEQSSVKIDVIHPSGKVVASGKTNISVDALKRSVAKINLEVDKPELWTLENPVLYQVRTRLEASANNISDEVITRCGFRTIEFTSDSGFFLNGKHVKIKGVCNHQDHAGVGVAVPDALWAFRIKRLKDMGANAYRCAHNPPAAEFLDACDSLGLLVMNENRNFNIGEDYIRQLEWMVRRDRNHPSIILWSVFNEEPMQGTENGYEMVRLMTSKVKNLDTTRPVTAAMNGGLFTPINVSQAVDVVGFNYQMGSYDKFHEANPNMKLTSSEDGCGLMTRGEYVTDPTRNIIDQYDSQSAAWGATHREAWKAIHQRPWLAGCFLWTGFDYRGEPTPYVWPSVSTFFGAMDVCGFPKTAFWIHQAQWREDINVLQLVPHWNWPKDSIGKKIKVMCLSNADSVTLYLNKKLIGGQKADYYEMNTWMVPYQPGRLEAFGFKKGKKISHFVVETTGEPASLRLLPDRKTIDNNGWDAMPVTVEALDSKGRHISTANVDITFEIKGSGKIIGHGNGNPNSHEPEKGNRRSLFNGLAQVIVQSEEGGNDPIVLIARSGRLKAGEVVIPVKQVPAVKSIAAEVPNFQLQDWQVSPFSVVKPNPNQNVALNDMNTWTSIKTGVLRQHESSGYFIYRTNFEPYQSQKAEGGVLSIKRLTGKAEVWVNGQLLANKESHTTEDLAIPFPASENVNLNILIEAPEGKKVGLGGVVTVLPKNQK
ncbi:beta-galactosidase GalA [Parapedobacter deserti]|uniref:Beta-galactosidase GalA n=1 Tax=Parapedobacter deserti TaxID=1912957 RepID=A0ABV7JKT8_9SPHI